MPFVRFGLATTGIDTPDFTYDSRLGSTAFDWLASVRDNFTWTRGPHTIKAGGHFEFMQNNEARGGTWPGDFTFSNNTSNPLNTNFAFSNAILGVTRSTPRPTSTAKRRTGSGGPSGTGRTRGRRRRASPSTTGAVPLLLAVHAAGPPGRQLRSVALRSGKAPRLYQPAIVNGTRVAFDPVTGQSLNPIFIGAYVPGTGDEANGMVKADRPGVPAGFRDLLKPQIEPRLGFLWDLTGAGTTVLHSSAGYFHQARLGGGSLGNLAATRRSSTIRSSTTAS